jgi:hypothetical protein
MIQPPQYWDYRLAYHIQLSKRDSWWVKNTQLASSFSTLTPFCCFLSAILLLVESAVSHSVISWNLMCMFHFDLQSKGLQGVFVAVVNVGPLIGYLLWLICCLSPLWRHFQPSHQMLCKRAIRTFRLRCSLQSLLVLRMRWACLCAQRRAF